MDEAKDPARADEQTYLKMWSHIVQKGFQLGSVVGVGAAVPITLFRNGFSSPGAQNQAIRNAGKSTIGGIAFAVALGLYKLNGESQDAVEDRVYRLYYNANQRRTDTFCQVGAPVGAAFALATLQRAPWSILGHAAGGTVLALIAHAATCPPKEQSQDVKSLKEQMRGAYKDAKNSVEKM